MSSSYKVTIPHGAYMLTLEGEGFSSQREAREALAKQLLDYGYKPPRFFGLIVQKELKGLPKEILLMMRGASR